MAGKVTVALVDREGNKKVVSASCPTPTAVKAQAFAVGLAALTGAKELSYSIAEGGRVLDDGYTAGTFDTVGHVANMRFVGADNQAFRFGVPAPIDAALDLNEEVTPEFAADAKALLETLRGDVLQYRGGRLQTKMVSEPITIPDLGAA